MKRVLVTADTVGGVWNYALGLMRALPEIEFALCTMGAPLSASQGGEVSALENVRLFPGGYMLEWMDDPWGDVDAAGEWLLKIAAEFRPDLVHLNGYAHAALGWNAPVVLVAHSCVLSWWCAVKGENAPARFDEYRKRVTNGLQAANVVIAPSRAMLESLRENYKAAFTARAIHNGCDLPRFSPPPKQAGILAAGRVWDEAKNLRALDTVAPRAKWPIEIAGEVSAPSREPTTFQNARLLGQLSAAQLAQAMASAAIFAAPARYEPFGLSILEAALSSCALVLGDIPSLRELWHDAAIFVDPDDHPSLAAALNRLSGDADLRQDLARRARQRALGFSIEDMAAEYRDLYSACSRIEVAA